MSQQKAIKYSKIGAFYEAQMKLILSYDEFLDENNPHTTTCNATKQHRHVEGVSVSNVFMRLIHSYATASVTILYLSIVYSRATYFNMSVVYSIAYWHVHTYSGRV